MAPCAEPAAQVMHGHDGLRVVTTADVQAEGAAAGLDAMPSELARDVRAQAEEQVPPGVQDELARSQGVQNELAWSQGVQPRCSGGSGEPPEPPTCCPLTRRKIPVLIISAIHTFT